MNLFLQYKEVSIIIHLLGLTIGMGAALVGDYLFFQFLKNLKLSNQESHTLTLVSKMVWFGLLILYISGILIFLSDPQHYMNSSKFIAKFFIVLCITANGALLHFYIKPKLKIIDWTKSDNPKQKKLKSLAFSAGAISVSSWLSALVLGSLPSLPFTTSTIILLYLTVILLAIISSQFMHILFAKYFKP